VQNEQTHLNDGMRDPIAQQESNTVNFQHNSLEQRQGKETEMLEFHREPRKSTFSGCLLLRECEQRYDNVGIGSNVVRGAMVEIVFVDPPAVAKPEQEI
jgi:hypothetical protein